MPNPRIVRFKSLLGRNFIVYRGDDGSVFLERVRRSGRRGRKTIFQFDPDVLRAAFRSL